jgi:hypothetical protein
LGHSKRRAVDNSQKKIESFARGAKTVVSRRATNERAKQDDQGKNEESIRDESPPEPANKNRAWFQPKPTPAILCGPGKSD